MRFELPTFFRRVLMMKVPPLQILALAVIAAFVDRLSVAGPA